MVLRLSEALELPRRECNELLRAAGFASEFSEPGSETEALGPYRDAVDLLFSSHEPSPACVVDRWGEIVRGNEAFEQLSPGATELTPEEFLTATFDTEQGRNRVLNWQELAWAYVDRMSIVARRTSDARIESMVSMVRGFLGGAPRRPPAADAHVVAQFRTDDTELTTFTTFLRFENARDVELSELTVELIFPADETTRRYFEHQARWSK
jgi:hypothetical protein